MKYLMVILFTPKKINKDYLTDANSNGEVLGAGVFGICSKKTYRGVTVAVKEFKENVSLSLVTHEASVLAKMEHPGSAARVKVRYK